MIEQIIEGTNDQANERIYISLLITTFAAIEVGPQADVTLPPLGVNPDVSRYDGWGYQMADHAVPVCVSYERLSENKHI